MVDAYQNVAMTSDMEMWRDKGRFDILKWIDPYPRPIKKNGHIVAGYHYWINPRTGKDVERCPWLRKVRGQDKYVCRINDVKPAVCRNYPFTKAQAKKTGCKGFEG
jgi:Fe-S-cluster containining protein